MDIISAYREAGTYRGAAQIAGTTHKTVKRVIARQEAGGAAPGRAPRGRNYDGVAALVAGRVNKTSRAGFLGEAAAAGASGRGLCGVGPGVPAAWWRRRKQAWRAGASPGPPPGGVVAG